jgi:hypothetical protein
MHPSLRTFLSPFVAVAFAALAVTGVLMSFDVENRAVTGLHQCSGWAFVVAGALHVIVNGRSLIAHLRQRAGAISVACALVLVAGILTVGALDEGSEHHGEHGERTQAAHADD